MNWSLLEKNEWWLRSDDGRWLGKVYPWRGGWCAETELYGLTTSPMDFETALHELQRFCEQRECATRAQEVRP